MIQPEPEDLPKDNPKLEIAVLRWRLLQLRVLNTKMHESSLVPKRSIKISLGHITFQTLVEHHQGSQAVIKSPTQYLVNCQNIQSVYFFSFTNDEWKSFQCHHQTALRSNGGNGNLNPIQMLNLRIHYYLVERSDLKTKTSSYSDLKLS
ncbi:hypothetical protein Tco_0703516 [Tanacetum coccineum]|uniref:Uncharacterized protein n=1 Tax=Tanacetum coccineum TaxID=301880 RepID=A0ABQ4Y0U6_9ASTR